MPYVNQALVLRRPRRGVGDISFLPKSTAGAPIKYLSAEYCASGLSLLDPIAWVGCLPRDAYNVGGTLTADAYEKLRYGSIPTVADLPLPPNPNAPQTVPQMTGDWTIDQAFVTREQWEEWKAAQRAAIQRAIDDGSYDPTGRDPLQWLKDFLEQYGLWIAGGVAAVVVLPSLLARGRR